MKLVKKGIISFLVLAISSTLFCLSPITASATSSQSINWLLQTATAEGVTNSNWEFLLGDYNHDGIPDLYCIDKANTASGDTEVHILNGSNNFQSFLLHTATILPTTDATWEFQLGDYNHDGNLDLYCIHKSGTSSGKTEVHILNGSNNFQTYLLHSATAEGVTDSNYNFQLGDYNHDGTLDLYCIQKANTSSGDTELHILNGSGNFQSFLLHIATALPTTDGTYEFQLGNYDNDNVPDLYCIHKSGTSSGKTEIHVLSGSSNYKTYLLHSATCCGPTDSNWTFLIGQGPYTFYGIQRNGNSSTTEVHAFGYPDLTAYGCSYVGVPYVPGGNTPSGWDCSGFTQYVLANYNISVAHSALTQSTLGIAVSKSNLQPGDLVFFCTNGSGTVTHVGIYIGNGNMVSAENESVGTIVDNINSAYWSPLYMGARRLIYIP